MGMKKPFARPARHRHDTEKFASYRNELVEIPANGAKAWAERSCHPERM